MTTTRRAAIWGYTTLAAAWLAVLPASALAPGVAHDSRWAIGLSALAYRAAGFTCHQDPVRSFHLGGWPLPVCARCTGLYAGGAAGALAGAIAMAAAARRTRRRPAGVMITTVRRILVAAAVPTALLWSAERLGGVPVSNLVRAGGAVPLGAAVSWVFVFLMTGHPLTDDTPASGIDLTA